MVLSFLLNGFVNDLFKVSVRDCGLCPFLKLVLSYPLLASTLMWLVIQHSFMSLCLRVVFILHNSLKMSVLLNFYPSVQLGRMVCPKMLSDIFSSLLDDVQGYRCCISLRPKNRPSFWETLFFL